MKRKQGVLSDGFLLIILGSYIVVLCITGKYSFYLHPKFMWLSLLSAVILWGLGFFKVFLSRKGMTRLQRIIFILFLLLCLLIKPYTVEIQYLPQLPF
jgi:hypothetical protein